jgi:Cation transporter/ATPase, N-terminus
MTETIEQASKPAAAPDPTEAVEDLLRSLRTHREGLSSREAQRRLAQYGPQPARAPGGHTVAA